MKESKELDHGRVLPVVDISLSACLDDGLPDIGSLWELCLYFEFNRAEVVDGIASWLGSPKELQILDCACGTGFPALDLICRGYDITCSDGSPLMLKHFRRNAQLKGLAIEPAQVTWEDLAKYYGGQFDVVMCRGGGSYLYAGTWDHDAPPDWNTLTCSIRQFVACLRPGGRLYVDITRAEDLARLEPQWTRHPRLLVGSHTVELEERITADLQSGTRVWHSWMQVDGITYEFERRSHYLPHERLIVLLTDVGLVNVHKETVRGERYDVFVGSLPDTMG